MKTRLGRRLAYAIDVPADARGRARIPPGMVITLVENAIKHGIEPCAARRRRSTVAARAWTATIAWRCRWPTPASGSTERARPGASALPTSASGWRSVRRSRASRARGERAARLRRPHRAAARRGADATIARGPPRVPAVAMNRPTALIAEDEPLMRERLKEQLAEAWPELEIVAEAADGDEALAAVRRRIARRSRSSTSGCRDAPGSTSRPRSAPTATSCSSPPTTSTRSQAFDAGAVDYLLKPVEADRLAATVDRVRRKLAARAGRPVGAARGAARGDARRGRRGCKWIKAAVGKQVQPHRRSTTSSISSPTPSTRASCSRSRRGADPHAAQGPARRARSRTGSGRFIAARSSTSTPSPACCARTPSGSSCCSRTGRRGCRSRASSSISSGRCRGGARASGRTAKIGRSADACMRFMRPVAIFRFSPTEGPGVLRRVARRAAAFRWSLVRARRGRRRCPPIRASSPASRMMGGPMSVNDALPWIAPLCGLLRDAIGDGVPVIGHCLGGQLLAKALGAPRDARAGRRRSAGCDVDVCDRGARARVVRRPPTLHDVPVALRRVRAAADGATRVLTNAFNVEPGATSSTTATSASSATSR